MKIKVAIPSSAKQFIRDYRLPLAATAFFIIIVLFLLIGRLHDRAALGQVLAINRSGSGGYASLLSNDAADDFKKRDVSADDSTVTSPSSSRTTVSGSATSTPAATAQAAATTTTGGSGTSTNNPPVVVVPFGAAITDFKQDQAPSLQCPNGLTGSLNISKCSKIYSFAGSIQTVSGPGRVDYEWRYSVSGTNNGTFTAASGTNVTTLHNQITLSCKSPVTFTAQFALTAPAANQSGTLRITHSCN